MYVCIYIYIIRINICIYTYIHTYIHTLIYSQLYSSTPGLEVVVGDANAYLLEEYDKQTDDEIAR